MKRSMLEVALLIASMLSLAACSATPISARPRAAERSIAPAQEAGYLALSLRTPDDEVHAQCAGAALCLGGCAPSDGHCRESCLGPARARAAFLLATLTACSEGAGCDGEERCMRRRCAGPIAACTGADPGPTY